MAFTSPTNPTTSNPAIDHFLNIIETQLINPLVTLLVLAAFVLFVFGVVEYIRNAANDEKRAEGQQHILWGIIGLVIIFGASALVSFLGSIVNSLKP